MTQHHRYNSPRMNHAAQRRFGPDEWVRLRQQKDQELADTRGQLAASRQMIAELQQQLAASTSDAEDVFIGVAEVDEPAIEQADAPADSEAVDPAVEPGPVAEDITPPQEPEKDNPIQPDPADEDDLSVRLTAAEARAEAAERQAAEAMAQVAGALQRQAALEEVVQTNAAQQDYTKALAELDRQFGGDLRAMAIDLANTELAGMGFGPDNLPPAQLVKDRLEIAYLRLARDRESAGTPANPAGPKAETLDAGIGGNASMPSLEGSLADVVADMKRAGKLR